MVKRKASKKKVSKAPRKRAVRRKSARTPKTAGRNVDLESVNESNAKNRKSHWEVYENLQKRADQAWAKLRSDVNRKAAPNVIAHARDELLLLLGECNYLAGEYMRSWKGQS